MPKRGLRQSGGRRSLRPRAVRGPAGADYDRAVHGSSYGHAVEPPPSAATRAAVAAPPPPAPREPEPESVPVVDAPARIAAELSDAPVPPPAAASLEPVEAPAHELEDRLLMEFFSSPPPPPEASVEEEEEDFAALHMSHGSKRAMWATLAIFTVSVVTIGGYAAYQQLVVPTPVELSGAGPVSALQPLAASSAPLTAATETSVSAVRAAEPVADLAAEARARRYLLTNGAAAKPVPGLILDAPAMAAQPADAVPSADVVPGAAVTMPASPLPTAVPSSNVVAPGSVVQPAQLGTPGSVTLPAAAPASAALLQPIAAAPAAALGQGAGLGDKLPPSAQPPAAAQLGAAVQPEVAAQLAVAARTAQPEQPSALPPSAASDAPAPTFDELLAAAQDLAHHDRHEPAFEAYQRALQLQPDSSPAMSGLAFTHLNLGDAPAAKLFASRAVAADPTNSEGWIVLGAAEDALGSRDAARDAYRQCAEHGAGNYVAECKRLTR